jgi:excisionase family DNA binding protein
MSNEQKANLMNLPDLDLGSPPEHRDHFEVMSTAEVAAHLNSSEGTVRRLFRASKIQASKVRGRWRATYCSVMCYQLSELTWL